MLREKVNGFLSEEWVTEGVRFRLDSRTNNRFEGPISAPRHFIGTIKNFSLEHLEQ
jgi:hypothetical protein